MLTQTIPHRQQNQRRLRNRAYLSRCEPRPNSNMSELTIESTLAASSDPKSNENGCLMDSRRAVSKTKLPSKSDAAMLTNRPRSSVVPTVSVGEEAVELYS